MTATYLVLHDALGRGHCFKHLHMLAVLQCADVPFKAGSVFRVRTRKRMKKSSPSILSRQPKRAASPLQLQ